MTNRVFYYLLSVRMKGRGRQAAKKTSPSGWDWDQERNDGLRVIGQLIELDIHRLWDPPVIEEDFVKYASLILFIICSFAHLFIY